MNAFWLGLLVIIYLLVLTYLGFRGYKKTRSEKDFLLAGGDCNPYVMAMSYGATFISSSAMIGFGGMAANFGMGMIWLCFLNMFVGVILAFTIFGRRTRNRGIKLNAHTFPEFLGASFGSRSIQAIAGTIIFLSMPLYAAVVLKSGAVFIEQIFEIDYNVSLFVFTLIIAFYVIAGGLKGVMYTDALQGTIMFVGIFFFLFWTYRTLGMGFTEANQELTNMANLVPEHLKEIGHQGWTAMPRWGSPHWYSLVTSLIMGVGIGCLAQPQLVVRFMTVKSDRELNRALAIGTVFIFIIVGTMYTVGALSNIFFMQTEGKLAMDVVGDIDKVIPYYIKEAMPGWFSAVFMLCVLSAGMSTLSSQFHVMGTSASHDFYSVLKPLKRHTNLTNRMGIVVAILISYVICYMLSNDIIARGTAIFFGVCAAAFLPAYVASLYSKNATKKGVLWSMIVGIVTSLFALLFLHKSEAVGLGICQALFGKPVLIEAYPWPLIDPMILSLPISTLVLVFVSMFDKNGVKRKS